MAMPKAFSKDMCEECLTLIVTRSHGTRIGSGRAGAHRARS